MGANWPVQKTEGKRWSAGRFSLKLVGQWYAR